MNLIYKIEPDYGKFSVNRESQLGVIFVLKTHNFMHLDESPNLAHFSIIAVKSVIIVIYMIFNVVVNELAGLNWQAFR